MNINEFASLFELPFDGFEKPVVFTDGSFGFSTSKRRRLSGYKSLFSLLITKDELDSTDQRKFVTIYADYGKISEEREDGIIISSTDMRRRLDWPVSLKSSHEFYCDFETKGFFFKDGKRFTGKKLLLYIEHIHTKPTKLLSGLPLRARLWFNLTFIPGLIKVTFNFLNYISGRRMELDYSFEKSSHTSQDEKKSDGAASEIENIDIFGFKIGREGALIYSVIHLALFMVFYFSNYRPRILMDLLTNTFLTLMYSVVSLSLIVFILKRLALASNSILSWLKEKYFQKIFSRVPLN